MTLIGCILVPLALFWLVRRPTHLYRALIFFLPFSATSIVNIGGKGIPAWMFLAALWMLRELLPELSSMRFNYPKNLRRMRFSLVLFCLVAACSLVMPIWLAGQITIESPILFSPDSELLHFDAKNITYLLYLWFGCLFALLLARKNSNRAAFVGTLKIYLSSILFVVIWGIFQWILLKTGIPYPGFIFNNSATETTRGFGTFLAAGVPRISSVAVEPSILAQVLLTTLPFVIFTSVLRFPVLSKRLNLWLLFLTAAVLILSTSFTAYIGSAIVMLTIVTAFYLTGILRFRHLLASIAILGTLMLAYVAVPPVTEFVNSQLLTKSESYSGIERIRTIILAYGYFMRSPILGLGWGSVVSHDLVMNLLSNAGIIGLISFLAFVVVVSRGLLRSIKSSYFAEEKCWKIAIALSFFTLLLINVFTGFAFVFGHLWLTVGLAMSASVLKYERPARAVAAGGGDQ